MDRTVHITSTHYKNPFWIDIQLKQLKKHLKVPYKTYMVHANMPEGYGDYTDDFDVLVSDSRKRFHQVNGAKLILPKITNNLKPNDIVIKLDSDAFFISDIDESFLDRVDSERFIALKEPKHEGKLTRHTAHPVFYAFKGEYLEKDFNGKSLTKALSNIKVDGGSNWWGHVDGWLRKNVEKWGVLERTNVTNLHSLYFGIYDDLIYHHWAGSRVMKTREDTRIAKKEKVQLDVILKRNIELNKSAIKEIGSDLDAFINKLKSK